MNKRHHCLALLVLIFSILTACGEKSSHEPLRVAYISHTYYINRHSDLQQMFIDEINAAKPKYVFALGDIVLMNKDHEWKATLEFFSKFDAPVYYSPGNHDLHNFDIVEGLMTDRHYPEWRQQYIDRIGYANTLVQDEQADFVLMNSNDPFRITGPFLEKSLEKANPETPTILLTHQRIWLERYRNNWVHWYFKSSRKEQMLPLIPKFDELVIGDLWGKMERKTVEQTPATMIGMGNNDKPAFWVLAELQENGSFSYEQKTLDLPEGHPYIYIKK